MDNLDGISYEWGARREESFILVYSAAKNRSFWPPRDKMNGSCLGESANPSPRRVRSLVEQGSLAAAVSFSRL